jgi:putative NADPH-quinone reductase
LTDKTAKIFCTCDAPGFIYKIPLILGIHLKRHLDRAILGFCGVKTTHFQLVSGFHKKSKEQREEILAAI